MNAPARIAELERQLHWAHLKIQLLEERLRQDRIQQLWVRRAKTLSNLQLALPTEEEPGTTRDEVEAEARRERIDSTTTWTRRNGSAMATSGAQTFAGGSAAGHPHPHLQRAHVRVLR